MTKGNKITKLKVVVEFSVYNQYYKPPKMKAKFDEETGYTFIDDGYCLSNHKDNPLYIKFNTGDVLEVKEITVLHNLKSFAYITFDNKTHKVPLEVLSFCTEKL